MKSKFNYFVLTLVTLSFLFINQQINAQNEMTKDKAILWARSALEEEGFDANRSIELLNGCLKQFNSTDCLIQRAKVYFFMKKYSDSVNDFTTVINKSADNTIQKWEMVSFDKNDDIYTYDLYASRGAAYYELKKPDLAISDFSKSIAMLRKETSKNAYFALFDYYRSRAMVYRDANKIDSSVQDLRSAYSLVYKLGLNKDQEFAAYNDIFEWLAILIEKAPQNAGGYHLRGDIYYQVNQSDNAIASYTKAISLSPNDSEAYYDRGYLYYRLKKYDLAIADFDKTIAQNNLPAAYLYKALSFEGKNDLTNAISAMTLAIKYMPTNEYYYNQRGLFYDRLEKYPEAIADYSKAIEINPKDWAYYANRGTAQSKIGNHEQAIKDTNQAVTLAPRDATAYNNRAFVYERADKLDLALADAKKAIELDPKSPGDYRIIGRVFKKQGKKDEAITYFLKALSFDPDNEKSKTELDNIGYKLTANDISSLKTRRLLIDNSWRFFEKNDLIRMKFYENNTFYLAHTFLGLEGKFEFNYTDRFKIKGETIGERGKVKFEGEVFKDANNNNLLKLTFDKPIGDTKQTQITLKIGN